MTITAVLIDSREPAWVQQLQFGGVPTAVTQLETGDLQVACDDNCILLVERKSPEDFLNSLRDERLFPQLAKLAHVRLDEQLAGQTHTWCYLIVSGEIQRTPDGKAVTLERGLTGWNWDAIQGTLLTAQEMGIFTVFCGGDDEYEGCILRLASRKREAEYKLLPPRIPQVLGPASALLAALPGIGIERAQELLRWSGNIPAYALAGLTDLEIAVPGIGQTTKKRIRQVLGLKDSQELNILINQINDEVLQVTEEVKNVF